MISLQADPPGLESIREVMLKSVAGLDIKVGVMEPLAVTGRINLNSESNLTCETVRQTHLPLVIETDQERI